MKTISICPQCATLLECGHCPECGSRAEEIQLLSHQLPPETVLAGKYLVGKVIGSGGFGITYQGLRIADRHLVAIKEYFPQMFVSRDCARSLNVTPVSPEAAAFVAKGIVGVRREAGILAKFYQTPGIVRVGDLFNENQTAYIVMEFVKGKTLERQISDSGPMAFGTLMDSMMPLMDVLASLHATGLIHRDITPGNIIVQPEGSFTLIDFGSAREQSLYGQKRMTVYVRRGFAPPEQYITNGKQGPWTDVYGLCATIFFALTGKLPILDAPLTGLPPQAREVLTRGLAPSIADRYPDMPALKAAFRAILPSQKKAPHRGPAAPMPPVPTPPATGVPSAGPEASALVRRFQTQKRIARVLRVVFPPCGKPALEAANAFEAAASLPEKLACLNTLRENNRNGFIAIGLVALVIFLLL